MRHPEHAKKLDLYYARREAMGTGDVVEVRSRTLIGWAIRRFTGRPVNHTALVIRLSQYDADRVFVLESLEHGVVLNLLSRRLASLSGNATWLPLLLQFSDARAAIGRAALSYVGVGYDFSGLFRQLFSRVSADARKLFCSEYAYLSLLSAGLPVMRTKAPWPGEMFGLGCFGRPRLIL